MLEKISKIHFLIFSRKCRTLYLKQFTSGHVSYAKIVHPDDLQRVAQEVTTFSNERKKTGFVHKPYRIISKDGGVKWLDDRTYIRRDNTGKIAHYEGIVVDITDSMQKDI